VLQQLPGNKEPLSNYDKVTYSVQVSAGGLATVASASESNDLLENWALAAIVQVLGLEDSIVLLAVADFVTLGLDLNLLVEVLLLFLPFLFKLEGSVLGELMNRVGGLAVAEKRLLSGGEVGHLLADLGTLVLISVLLLLLLLLLNAVGVDFIPARSGHVQLDLSEEGPLDVGDGLGLGSFDVEVLDNAALQVDQEGLLQVGLEMAWDLGGL
jgi:hypothetical protein